MLQPYPDTAFVRAGLHAGGQAIRDRFILGSDAGVSTNGSLDEKQ
jgi:hypothetical protein